MCLLISHVSRILTFLCNSVFKQSFTQSLYFLSLNFCFRSTFNLRQSRATLLHQNLYISCMLYIFHEFFIQSLKKLNLVTRCMMPNLLNMQSFIRICCERMEIWDAKLSNLNSQKRIRPIASHLDRTSLVNKGFIIWLSGTFFLLDRAGSRERAR